MSLIKREMKFQNIRLGKIGDHIWTNRKIKLRENRRNIKNYRAEITAQVFLVPQH
jgi:hypothetical protein